MREAGRGTGGRGSSVPRPGIFSASSSSSSVFTRSSPITVGDSRAQLVEHARSCLAKSDGPRRANDAPQTEHKKNGSSTAPSDPSAVPVRHRRSCRSKSGRSRRGNDTPQRAHKRDASPARARSRSAEPRSSATDDDERSATPGNGTERALPKHETLHATLLLSILCKYIINYRIRPN